MRVDHYVIIMQRRCQPRLRAMETAQVSFSVKLAKYVSRTFANLRAGGSIHLPMQTNAEVHLLNRDNFGNGSVCLLLGK